MPNFKITDFTELNDTQADDLDLVEVVDLSDTTMDPSGTNKRMTLESLRDFVGGGSGPTLWEEGAPVANQRPNWDFRGGGVRIEDNPGDDSSRIIIENANGQNVGGGSEVFRDITSGEPDTVNFRTLVAGSGAVVSQIGDVIEISATGVGGGEVNELRNDGTGGVDITLTKTDRFLPVKSMYAATPTLLSIADGGGSNRVEFTLNESAIDHANIANGGGSNSHAAIDAHIDSSANIHFTIATSAGAGLIPQASTYDVGAGAGITVNANDVAVSFGGDGAATTVARSDHDHSTNQIGTTGLADSAVTNGKMADMAAHTVKTGPAAGSSAPVDLTEAAATDHGAYANGQSVLGWEGGVLGKFTSFPAGGGSSPTTTEGDMIIHGTAVEGDIRLPLGSPTDVLTVDAGRPAWRPSQSKHEIQEEYLPRNARTALNFRQAFTVNDEVGTDSTDVFITAAPNTNGDLWTYFGTAPTKVAIGTPGQVLKVNSGGTLPEWQNDSGGSVTDPPSVKGELWTHDGANNVSLPVGGNGLVLEADSTAPTGLKWGTKTGTGGTGTYQFTQENGVGVATDDTTLNFTTSSSVAPSVVTAADVTGVSFAAIPGGIDHDQLLNFTAQEHVNHAAVSIVAGNGLTGGGDITTNRTLDVGAGDGISVAASSVAVDSTVARLNAAADFTVSLAEAGVEAIWSGFNAAYDGSALNFTPGQTPHLQITGAVTVNPPASGEGVAAVLCTAASTPTISGTFTNVIGTRTAAKAQTATMTRVGTDTWFIWGPAEA